MQTFPGLRWREWGDERTTGMLTNATTEPKDGVGRHWGAVLERALVRQEPLGLKVVDVAKVVLISAHGPIRGARSSTRKEKRHDVLTRR